MLLARTVPLLLDDELEDEVLTTGVTTSALAEVLVLGRLEDSLPWPQLTSPIKQGSSNKYFI